MSEGAPFFVDPHKPESEGVDFLGLRSLNFTMMDRLMPGINNVVSMIRPFTVMSWIAWRFAQGVASRNAPTVSTTEFEVFKQKVETVFAYSQVQAGNANGLPGRQQRTPEGDVIRFQFAAFKRTGSILDAALYGPAIKSLSGLAFIRQHPDARFMIVTPAGERLALALDVNLRYHLTHEQYTFISSLTDTDARRELIDGKFSKAWDLSDVSGDEQQTFRERLFQPETIGATHPDARRSAVIAYVIELLREQHEPLAVAEVRRLLACHFPRSLIGHPKRQTFMQMQRYWQLLQVRQAQRLALEALFGWVERALWRGATGVYELSVLACDSLHIQPGTLADADYLSAQMLELRDAGKDVDALFAAGLKAPSGWDIFVLSDELEMAMKKQPKDIVRLSMRILLLTACYAEAFKVDQTTRFEVDAGPKFRLPLGGWAEFVRNHELQPLSQVLHKLLGSFIISQHLGIAAARSSDEKSRMRLSIEDRGLTSLLPGPLKALSPRRTPDRLASGMALMAECGLLRLAANSVSAEGAKYSVI